MTRTEIHDVLVRAKALYIQRMVKNTHATFFRCAGMCYHIDYILTADNCVDISYTYAYITDIIPEFTPEFFGLSESINKRDYWWGNRDTNSRIEAFDKLIKVYE